MNIQQAIIAFNRTAGQFKRYYGISGADFFPTTKNITVKQILKAKQKMEREAERQRVRKAVEEYNRKQEEQRQKREIEAKQTVENILEVLKNADNGKTVLGKIEIHRSFEIINSMIQESIRTWGYVFTAEHLKKFAGETYEKLQRMIRAIYDSEYNTNMGFYQRDRAGDIGRDRYRMDFQQLSRELKVPLPQIYYV